MGKCLTDAGILVHPDGDKLTQVAKDVFVDDVIAELQQGSLSPLNIAFPCGPEIEPNPFAYQLTDLKNEQKYPDFHKNFIGTYEKIAIELNLNSGFKLMPICDPLALALQIPDLNLKIKIPLVDYPQFMIPNLPGLAVKLNLEPPDIPQIQLPPIPEIPDIQIPALPLPLLLDLEAYLNLTIPNIPKFILDLVPNLPKLLIKIPNINLMLKFVCDLASDAGFYGPPPPSTLQQATVQLAASRVLVRKILEMMLLVAVGTTIGSAPGGVVGGMGREFRYVPPVDDQPPEEKSPRDRIVAYAKKCAGLSWGDSSKRADYTRRLLYVESQEPVEGPQGDPRALGLDEAMNRASQASSCGMVARACLMAGGASYVSNNRVDISKIDPTSDYSLYYDFYKDRYLVGRAISGIIQSAVDKGALLGGDHSAVNHPARPVKDDLIFDGQPVKRGDVIIVYSKTRSGQEHAMVVIEDYEPGSYRLLTIEGGQVDANNKNPLYPLRRLPTAIKRKEYQWLPPNQLDNDFDYISKEGYTNKIIFTKSRHILAVIDGEKLCTSTAYSNMSTLGQAISANYFDGNDDDDPSQDS